MSSARTGGSATPDAPGGSASSSQPQQRPPMKKGKSCDACKHRKVACKFVSPLEVCEQCIRHSVPCLQTPHVRKRMAPRNGKRIEMARLAATGTASEQPPEPTLVKMESTLAIAQLSSLLANHLIELYQFSPGLYLRLFPLRNLVRDVEEVSGRLDLLPPDTEALARTVIAQTSRFSSHPLLFGPSASASSSGIPAIDLSANVTDLPFNDLREFGSRRTAVCTQLREAAVKCVWEKGIMAKMDCEENAGACWILSRLLDEAEPGAGTPYLSAATMQLRLLAARGITGRDTKWRFMLLLEALYSLKVGMPSSFHDSDWQLLCGPLPRPLAEFVAEARHPQNPDVFDLFVNPFLYHAAALAKDCVNRFSGPYARHQPLNPLAIQEYLTSLESLHLLLVALDSKAAVFLGIGSSQSTYKLTELAACRHLVILAWCILAMAPIQEIQRRLHQLRDGEGIGSAVSRDSLELMLDQVRRVAGGAARVFAERMRQIKGLPYLSSPDLVDLDWVAVWELMRDTPTVDSERRERTGWLLRTAKIGGWMGQHRPSEGGAIAEMESYLAAPTSNDFGLHLPRAPSFLSHASFPPSTATFSPATDAPFDPNPFGTSWPPSSMPNSTAPTPDTVDISYQASAEPHHWMASEVNTAPDLGFDPPSAPPSVPSLPISRWAGYGDGWGFEIADGQYI